MPNDLNGVIKLPDYTWRGIREARDLSWQKFGKKIYFYAPGFIYYYNKYFKSSSLSFPSISITGSYCSLKCDHCGGRILKTMIPARTPDKLIEICADLKERGATGCLISGGCLPNGSVPVLRFIDAICEIKKRFGLIIVVHTGLIDFEVAKKLKEAGVDAVSIDIVGSEETIKRVYHLNASVDGYAKTLEALKKAELPFTPHVLIGLHYGSVRGEIEALKIISKYDPSALILIVFFPIKGTKMENINPPPYEAVIDILVKARFLMNNIPIALGCARPKGNYRSIVDLLFVEAGVNAIAFPSIEAIERAKKLGLKIVFSPTCCSLIQKDINLSSS